MVHKIGQLVEARKPDTRIYAEAEVLAYTNGIYNVKFMDGFSHSVLEKYVRTALPKRVRNRSKSPARMSIANSETPKTKALRKSNKSQNDDPEFMPRLTRSKSPGRISTRVGSPRKTTQAKTTKQRMEVSSEKILETKFVHVTESEIMSGGRSPGRVKTVGIVSPTSTIPKKVWPTEAIKKSATIILHDVLNPESSRSNSRQSSSSRTNSELGAIDRASINVQGRETPLWLESDFSSLEHEESVTEHKPKVFSQSVRRLTRTPEVEPFTKSHTLTQRGLTPVNEMMSNEVSDEDVEVSTNYRGKQMPPLINLAFAITARLFELFLLICVLSCPLICAYLFHSCKTRTCIFKVPQLGQFMHIEEFFSLEATYIYLTFFWLVVILSFMAILGTHTFGLPNKNGIAKYYFNGLFTTAVIVVTTLSLEWYEIPVFRYIYEQDFRLLVVSLFCAFLISVFLFCRSFFIPIALLNPNGYTDSSFMDFWIGREVNPRILSIFDVKVTNYRMAIIASIILHISYGYNDLQNFVSSIIHNKPIDYNVTLLVLVMLNIIFNLDLMLHEKQLITSLEIQFDGMGFMLSLKNAIYPFFTAFVSKYILHLNLRVPVPVLIATVFIFVLGYALFRYSNNMKYAVRVNPSDTRFRYRDMYMTYSGKQLLVAKTWGFVRHPNYLGHILVLLSNSIPLFCVVPLSAIPFIPIVFSILFLMQRASRDHRCCEKKHSSSWNRYCGIVKYKLIPGIF